jgi:lysophospholipase L1-like esterase
VIGLGAPGVRPHHRLVAVLFVAAAGLVSSGCAGGGTSVTPGTEAHVAPYTYVAIGGSESVGFDANDPVRQAFPVLFDHRLPHQTVFYDVAVPDAGAVDVLAHQEAAAVALHPNLVTVWVGLSDLEAGMSPAEFRSELQAIVAPLRALHAQVLLANIEPITETVAYRSCAGVHGSPPDSGHFRCFVDRRFGGDTLPPADATNAVLAAYDTQVAAVAHQDGAVLVDVGAAMSRSGARSASLFSTDDFDLSTAGHALAAQMFLSAWRTTRSASSSR